MPDLEILKLNIPLNIFQVQYNCQLNCQFPVAAKTFGILQRL